MRWGNKAMSWERRFKMEEEKIVQSVEEIDAQPLSFDEIIADKEYQREFDKKVSKALETARGKWEKEIETIKTEAEKLAKMDAEEKANYKLEQAKKKAEEIEAKLNAYELKEEASKIAKEKGVPQSLLNIIDYTKENAESIKTKIEEIEVTYKQALQEGINDRMKEKTPKQVVENTTITNKPRASF